MLTNNISQPFSIKHNKNYSSSGIEKLENLQTLSLSNLIIRDYSPLFKCDKLKTVYAQQIPEDIANALIDKGIEVKAETVK